MTDIEKKFEGFLILNWKTKEIKITKRKPIQSRLSPFQIPIKLCINVKIPQPKEIVAKGEIEVPEYKVNKMIIESL